MRRQSSFTTKSAVAICLLGLFAAELPLKTVLLEQMEPDVLVFKKILPLCLLFAGCAPTQLPERSADELPSEELFLGANVLLIQSEDAPDAMREKVVQLLRLQDYEITQRTLDSPTIATEPRTFGSGTPGSARYFFDIPSAAGDPIRAYGEFILEQAGDSPSFQQFRAYAVSPEGDRRSTSRVSWLELGELVESYSGGSILYDRR